MILVILHSDPLITYCTAERHPPTHLFLFVSILQGDYRYYIIYLISFYKLITIIKCYHEVVKLLVQIWIKIYQYLKNVI